MGNGGIWPGGTYAGGWTPVPVGSPTESAVKTQFFTYISKEDKKNGTALYRVRV